MDAAGDHGFSGRFMRRTSAVISGMRGLVTDVVGLNFTVGRLTPDCGRDVGDVAVSTLIFDVTFGDRPFMAEFPFLSNAPPIVPFVSAIFYTDR